MPFHHHFELVGWAETTVIRFWLLTQVSVSRSSGEWLTTDRA
jgi:phospho-N-acetylmuramoyl-pentapeptide-transferase